MKHLLALLSFTLVFLAHSSHLRAQDVHSFIESYKSAYGKYIEKGKFDKKLMYVPSIMNLHEEKNVSWFNLSLQERQQNLLEYVYCPILENGFALDVKKGEYFYFPNNVRYYNKFPCKRVKLQNGSRITPPSVERLMKHLQNNHADYVFTIFNLGEDFGKRNWYERHFWVIADNQLYFLLYDKDKDELYPVEATEFINENIGFFEYFWEN